MCGPFRVSLNGSEAILVYVRVCHHQLGTLEWMPQSSHFFLMRSPELEPSWVVLYVQFSSNLTPNCSWVAELSSWAKKDVIKAGQIALRKNDNRMMSHKLKNCAKFLWQRENYTQWNWLVNKAQNLASCTSRQKPADQPSSSLWRFNLPADKLNNFFIYEEADCKIDSFDLWVFCKNRPESCCDVHYFCWSI